MTGGTLTSAAAEQIGTSDCEVIGAGWMAQPVNTLTSLAYVVAGLVVLVRGVRAAPGLRLVQVIYGATLVTVGLGSVAYHGPQPPWARFAHDLSIIAVLALILVVDLRCLAGWSQATVFLGFAGVVLLAGSLLVVAPDTGVAMMGVAGFGVVAAEVAVNRSGVLGSRRRSAVLYALIGSLVAGGVLLNAVGRTGGALCDPDSLVQLHAAWHVLTAAAFAMWPWVAFPADSDRDAALAT